MLKKVGFNSDDYGIEIARILASAGAGARPMPLVKDRAPDAGGRDAVARLENASACVRAGLHLYLGNWDDAHSIADSVENRTGYFWHAIVHRQEPDSANAGYWFRKAGKHPIFPELAAAADHAGYGNGRVWDAFRFVDFCGRAIPDSAAEHLAQQVQLIEWQLLFDYSARGANC
jgi:hypothetical protein